ncbi:Arc family DNA-binding protein [Aliihoeflea sp. 40Bstr573]|uniref:Arc family DNA-binding protein n=1 Tax=Aliihoeflea sp. 40Bstr573 TaxID=2696467 RepID=UPI0020961C53|nr:Arc family DNA-binding protein [Aliihoeflea sp. 40Bstr573]MCO6386217.1 Arc family DNA-binding protein [Aliihoeflea sp. 40Bstr573]
MNAKRTKSDGFMLRLPDGMRDQLREAADNNGRSMNSEIIARIDRSFEDGLPMPIGLKLQLKSAAEVNERPVRDEVVARLEASFEERSQADISALNEANARAEKFERLMRQARSRLGQLRYERDRLAAYVKVVNEGIEEDFMGQLKVRDLDEKSLLLKTYFQVMRLNTELLMQRGFVPPAGPDVAQIEMWEREADQDAEK